MLLKHTLFVITGANRGFGKAIAETFASNTKDTRTTLVLVGRDPAQFSTIECKNQKVSCHTISQVNLNGAIEAQSTVIDKLDALLKVILTLKPAKVAYSFNFSCRPGRKMISRQLQMLY